MSYNELAVIITLWLATCFLVGYKTKGFFVERRKIDPVRHKWCKLLEYSCKGCNYRCSPLTFVELKIFEQDVKDNQKRS